MHPLRAMHQKQKRLRPYWDEGAGASRYHPTSGRTCPASQPTPIRVAVRLTENHSGQVYLAVAVRLATPEGCSAARLCLTHTGFRLAGQRGVGLLVSIAVVGIRLGLIMPEEKPSVNDRLSVMRARVAEPTYISPSRRGQASHHVSRIHNQVGWLVPDNEHHKLRPAPDLWLL